MRSAIQCFSVKTTKTRRHTPWHISVHIMYFKRSMHLAQAISQSALMHRVTEAPFGGCL
jgi:hypothetical protein